MQQTLGKIQPWIGSCPEMASNNYVQITFFFFPKKFLFIFSNRVFVVTLISSLRETTSSDNHCTCILRDGCIEMPLKEVQLCKEMWTSDK